MSRWIKLTDRNGQPVYLHGDRAVLAAFRDEDGYTQLMMSNGGHPRVREPLEHVITMLQASEPQP